MKNELLININIHKKGKRQMIDEEIYRKERLPLRMYYDAWLFNIERQKQLEIAKKKFNNINRDKLL